MKEIDFSTLATKLRFRSILLTVALKKSLKSQGVQMLVNTVCKENLSIYLFCTYAGIVGL